MNKDISSNPAKPATIPTHKFTVGLGGFFGYGNYGDELFLKVFDEHLGDTFNLKILPDLLAKPYFSRPIEEMVADVDAVLIGGGDLVQPWSIDQRYFSPAYLKKPVFIAGVGVPIRAQNKDNPQGNENAAALDRYQRFFNNPSVRFINARDGQSVQWIQKKLAPAIPVIESPDLVCALTLPPIKNKPKNVLGIVTRHRPGHEEDDDYSQIQRLAEYAKTKGWKIHHIILGTDDVGKRDVANAQRLVVPGKEVIYSEDLDTLTRAIGQCSAFASMKFHGSVVATMYGIPSVVMVPTSKNRNFMRRMGREDLLCRFDAPDLVDRFKPFPAPITQEWVATLRTGATDMLRNLKQQILSVLQP